MSLLDTLRTGGSSGKVVIDINTADDQRRHFDRFCSRLNAGELVRASCLYCCISNSLACSSSQLLAWMFSPSVRQIMA